MTFICKFCGSEVLKKQESLAHINMCIACYNMTQRHRRLIQLDPKSLRETDKVFMKDFEERCSSNRTEGKYYPQYQEAHSVTCKYCGEKFDTVLNTTQCQKCKTIESRYRAALRNKSSLKGFSDKIDKYEVYYFEQRQKGFKIPKIANRTP